MNHFSAPYLVLFRNGFHVQQLQNGDICLVGIPSVPDMKDELVIPYLKELVLHIDSDRDDCYRLRYRPKFVQEFLKSKVIAYLKDRADSYTKQQGQQVFLRASSLFDKKCLHNLPIFEVIQLECMDSEQAHTKFKSRTSSSTNSESTVL